MGIIEYTYHDERNKNDKNKSKPLKQSTAIYSPQQLLMPSKDGLLTGTGGTRMPTQSMPFRNRANMPIILPACAKNSNVCKGLWLYRRKLFVCISYRRNHRKRDF